MGAGKRAELIVAEKATTQLSRDNSSRESQIKPIEFKFDSAQISKLAAPRFSGDMAKPIQSITR